MTRHATPFCIPPRFEVRLFWPRVTVAMFRLMCLGGFIALSCLFAFSVQAKPNVAPSPTVDMQRPYIVLGHTSLAQRLVHDNRAWTLGEDGVIVAWAKRDQLWWPIGVRKVPDTQAIALVQQQLWAFSTSNVVALDRQQLQPIKSSLQGELRTCGEGTVWTLHEGTLCVNRGEQNAFVCTDESTPSSWFADAYCEKDATRRCLHHWDGNADVRWCYDVDNGWSSPNAEISKDVNLSSPIERRVPSSEKETSDEEAPSFFLSCTDERTNRSCRRSPIGTGPQSTPVTSRTPVDLLWSDNGLFIVYTNGWYAVPTKAKAANPPRTLVEGSVWLEGPVRGWGIADDQAHIAYCLKEPDGYSVIDINIESQAATTMLSDAPACPARIVYQDGEIRMSFPDHDAIWQRGEQRLVDADKQIFTATHAVAWHLERGASRACQYHTWQLSIRVPGSGEFPLDGPFCASSVIPTTWISSNGQRGGPGYIVSRDNDTTLLLMNGQTLQRHYVRVGGTVSPMVHIVQQEANDWLLLDAGTATANSLSPSGERGEPRPLLWFASRLWERRDGGIYTQGDQHAMLITDDGVVLDGVGIGDITQRTVTSSLQRVLRDPDTFISRLHALSHIKTMHADAR